jgi:purine nucleosidase
MSTTKALKVVIDCDPGCDDALALMYAFGSKELDVVAVTTCAGNASVSTTTRNASAVLSFLGQADVPLFSGCAKPLRRRLELSVVHGESGLGSLRLPAGKWAGAQAPRELTQVARSLPGEVTLIALAPLTNLAAAYKLDPSGFRMFKELVILGGTVHAPGNKGPLSEFNFYVDPEAAAVVLTAGVPIRLVTLDACYPISLRRKDFGRVKNGKLRRAILDLLGPYMQGNWKEEGIRGAIMYDPLAVFCALRPVRTQGKPMRGAIETESRQTRGMLIIDSRLKAQGPENIRVITHISRAEFERSLFGALNVLSSSLKSTS